METPFDALCTTCWTVPPCKHFPAPGQSTDPERYQPHHLCVLCARTWAPLHSRWSWLACVNCRDVNQQIRQAYGACLPLGRHSIMNGAAVNLSEPDPRIRARQQAHLEEVFEQMHSLWEWKHRQAAQILATLMPPEHRTAQRIPTGVWAEHSEPSWEASSRAWLAYSDLTDYTELHERMLRLYSSGRLQWPPIIAISGWKPEPPSEPVT